MKQPMLGRSVVAVLVAALLVLPAAPAGAPPSAKTDLPRLSAVPDPVGGGRIVDELGRTVLLRGVNVNQLAEYWKGTDFPTTFPLPESDFDLIASFGWNAVRLLVSWSRIEPAPGQYDEEYLDRVAEAAEWAGERGIYVIVDLHQDAWGPHLAARPDEACPPGTTPSIGWDGAPLWATLDDGLPRCYANNREISWAVGQSFQSFWANRPAADSVGIQTRYVDMLRHLSMRFTEPWIAGFDLMNEPNPGYLVGANDSTLLHLFYARALEAIRGGEREAGVPPRLVFFEPGAQWSAISTTPAPPFTADPSVVYAPHIYTGSLGPGEVRFGFESAQREARLYLGAPVLSGEWGGGPERAGPGGDGYFVAHQDLQDEFRFSATLWTWRESCGDPHKAEDIRAGRVPTVWGLFDVDCRTNEILGMREALRTDLLRAYPRAASGTLESTRYDHDTGTVDVRGTAVATDGPTEIVYPAAKHRAKRLEISVEGLEDVRVRRRPNGLIVISAAPTGGPWRLTASPKRPPG